MAVVRIQNPLQVFGDENMYPVYHSLCSSLHLDAYCNSVFTVGLDDFLCGCAMTLLVG